MSDVTSISQLIDMTRDQYVEHISGISNLTELNGLKKLFEAEYQRVSLVKDGLLDMKKTKKYVEPATPYNVDKSLQELYSVLMIIEDRCAVIVDEQKRRSVPVKD